jgi:hypothetical protein
MPRYNIKNYFVKQQNKKRKSRELEIEDTEMKEEKNIKYPIRYMLGYIPYVIGVKKENYALVMSEPTNHTKKELTSTKGVSGYKYTKPYLDNISKKIEEDKNIENFDDIIDITYKKDKYGKVKYLNKEKIVEYYTVRWKINADSLLSDLIKSHGIKEEEIEKLQEVTKSDIEEIVMKRKKIEGKQVFYYYIKFKDTIKDKIVIPSYNIKNEKDEIMKELKEGIWIEENILEGLYSKEELKKIPYYTVIMFKKAYESLNIEEQVDYVEVVTDKKTDYNKYRKQGIKLKCSKSERVKMTIEKYLFTEIINIKNTNSGVGRVDKTNILIIPQNVRTDIYIKLYKEYNYTDNKTIENLEDILDNILKEGVTGEENEMSVTYYVLASYYVVTNVVDIFNKLKKEGKSGDKRTDAIYNFFNSIEPLVKQNIYEDKDIEKIVTNLFLFIDSLHDFNKNRLSNYIGIWKEINGNNETFLDYYVKEVFKGDNYKQTILYPLKKLNNSLKDKILKSLQDLCLIIKDTNFEKHLLMSYIVYYYLLPNIEEGKTINKEIVDKLLFGNTNNDIHKGINDNDYFVDFVRYDNAEDKYNNDALRKYSYAALFDANPKNKTRNRDSYKVSSYSTIRDIPVCTEFNKEECIKYFINLNKTSAYPCLYIKFPENFYINQAQIYCNEACPTSFIKPIVKEYEIRDKLKDIKDPYKESLIKRLQKIFSKNLYENKGKLMYKEYFDSPSVNDLFALIIWNKIEGKLTLQILDNLLSIKRIGDFGQIIDAKAQGISLLTEDSMEILLSIIKDVKCFIPYSNKNFLFFDNSIEIAKLHIDSVKNYFKLNEGIEEDDKEGIEEYFLEHKFYEKYITDKTIWSEKESIPMIPQAEEYKENNIIPTISRKRISSTSQLQSSTTPVQFTSLYEILNPSKGDNREEQTRIKRSRLQHIKRKYRYL